MRSRASSPLMPPLSEIAAIILAAGLSSRFEAGPVQTTAEILRASGRRADVEDD
jgi:hypothetical protein